jgi:hypothetical protein
MANPDNTPAAGGGGDPGMGVGGGTGAGTGAGGTLATPPVEPVVASTPPAEPKVEGDKGAAPPKAPPASAADPSAPKGDPSPTTWPEDWRKLVAGEDKKKAERLARFTDPGKILDSFLALEKDLSSGKYRKALPSHYSSEELAEWRKANGVPEKPEDYDVNLGNGIVWGETDKPHIDDFLKWAHEHNATPDEVKRNLGWWAQYQDRLVDQQNESDATNAQAASQKLRELWGGETTKNQNFLKTVFDRYDGAYATIMTARGPDGRRIGDNPDILNALVAEFVKGDPYARDLPGNGQAAAQTVEAEYATLQGLMRDRESKYWKGNDAQGLQARFRELVGLKERIAAAGARG